MLPIVLVLGGTVALFYYITKAFYDIRNRYPADIPLVEPPPGTKYEDVVKAQYAKDPDQIYILRTRTRDVFMLPPRYMKEFAWLREDRASSAVDVYERLCGRYTFLGSAHPDQPGDQMYAAIKYVQGPLTRNITQKLDKIYGEIDRVLDREVSNGAGRILNIDSLTTEIYLHVFEMVLVGDDLGHDEEWLRIFANYPRVAFEAALKLARYHYVLRPLAACLIPDMRRLLNYRQEVYNILHTFHQERLREMQDPGFHKPDDYIQSYIDNAGAERGNTWTLAESISGTSMAGIQTTARVELYQTLFDLVEYPEYIGPIREEINRAVSQEEGSANINHAGLLSLVKLDSFIKESQKFHYNNLVSSNRKLFKPLTLSDGTKLPQNAHISIPGLAHAVIDKSGSTRPFRGFQWAEKKTTAENPSIYNYVFSGQDDLEFGAGLHACPGRWFASIALKAALVRILLRYDFRLPDGQVRPVDSYNDGLEMEHDVTAKLQFFTRDSGVVLHGDLN